MPLPFQDDQIGELAEEATPQSEKVETERQEERDVDMEETVTTQVVEKKQNNLGYSYSPACLSWWINQLFAIVWF